MIRIALIFLAVVALAGCETFKTPKYATDNELRVELFHQCLERVPEGPTQTTFNDWSEVVDSCSAHAYRASQYCYDNCPPMRQEQDDG